jgi:two-component system, NtrC family, response regulator HydG
MGWCGEQGDLVLEFAGVAGSSPRIREIFQLLEMVAPSEATVLLLGETGTGKELVAQAIHRSSPRVAGPFVVVNCAALPETLLESELFGHERGAFTGATNRKDGRFLLAHHGTLFLDEIGELSLPIQAKILRVLQAREFEPLGSNRTVKVDVRIIAATNRDLATMVREGRFRDDLYYRLNVFPLVLPPLRERLEDLPGLVEFFLKKSREKNRREITSLSPEAHQALRRHPWPGNIRELENVIERGVIVCQGNILTPEDLPPALQPRAGFPEAGEEGEPGLPELERQLISRTLEKVAGRRWRAAEILGISLDELNLKIRSYRLEESEYSRR